MKKLLALIFVMSLFQLQMSAKTTKQVRLKATTVERALSIEGRTGIAEKTVYALAVEAGMPSVEKAAEEIKRASASNPEVAK